MSPGALLVDHTTASAEVAREMLRGMGAVREFRRRASDAYNFNWLLRIPHDLQHPFEPTHQAMAALKKDDPRLALELLDYSAASVL